MRTAAAKGRSWRLIAAALAVLVAAGAAEASRFSPGAATDLLEKQGISSVAAAQHAGDLAPAFASDPVTRFPLLTAADRQAFTAPLAGELAAALEAVGGEKLASGGLTSELRPNLWRLQELTTILHPSRFGYARARWYDARNASWLSEDPAQDVDSPNLYAYVAHAPHMATDPLGLADDWAFAPGGLKEPRPSAAPNPALERGIRDAVAGRVVGFTLLMDASQPTSAGFAARMQMSAAFAGHVQQRVAEARASGGTAMEGAIVGVGEQLPGLATVFNAIELGAGAGPYKGPLSQAEIDYRKGQMTVDIAELGAIGLSARFLVRPGTIHKSLFEEFGVTPGKGLNLDVASAPGGRSYITYGFRGFDAQIAYVGRASGPGTPLEVLRQRITKGHEHFLSGDTPEVLHVQSSQLANQGAEEFFIQGYLELGARLRNRSPAVSYDPRRTPRTLEKLDAFFEELLSGQGR